MLLSNILPHVEQKIKVTEPGFTTFLKLSAELTGFFTEELMGTGMSETYYYTLMKEFDQDLVREFLQKADQILSDSATVSQQIRKHFIPLPPDPKHPPGLATLPYEGLAQRIILLWYTGIWTSISGVPGGEPVITSAMVSAQAYTHGLIWTVAETHPAGARQPGFNSWSRPPLAS